jgi:hypothetical protein
MKNRNYITLTLALLTLAMTVPDARAQVLQFKDTYDVDATSNDINFENDNTNRQSGSLAPLTYTATANGSGFVQLGNPDFPNRLVLDTAYESYVSPDYNFTDASKFSIDFDVWPEANETSGFTGNWAAIVFGATTKNVFVNQSDGMGILFNDDGRMQAFDGSTGLGSVSNAIPTRAFAHVRLEVYTTGFGLGSPATVTLFVNGVQQRIDPGAINPMEHVKTNGFNANYITFVGQANGQGQVNGRWIHLFDNLEVNATNATNAPPPPPPYVPPSSLLLFEDTYDVDATSNDINFENDNTNRQSGSLAPLTYTATANGSGFVQLGNPDFPNRLVLDTAYEDYVSPNYNFTNGGDFNIDFDVWPEANETSGFTGNWAAIVFGASTQNAYVNASDGMGIFFRDDGLMNVWDGVSQIWGAANAIPTRTFAHIRFEVGSGGFGLGSPATVKLFVNGVQKQIDPNTMEHVRTNGFNANYITFMSEASGAGKVNGRWIYLFDNLKISVPLPSLTISRLTDGTLRISWPVSATGYTLQETTALPGGWANSSAAVIVQGSENVVEVTPTGATKFFRLLQ